jgi:hypothetical protein
VTLLFNFKRFLLDWEWTSLFLLLRTLLLSLDRDGIVIVAPLELCLFGLDLVGSVVNFFGVAVLKWLSQILFARAGKDLDRFLVKLKIYFHALHKLANDCFLSLKC